MNNLREMLAELIGAEVQAHSVTVAGKTKLLHFRQFDDATGQRIFSVIEGEGSEARGLRIMKAVVAASLCWPDGSLAGTLDEVLKLPMAVVEPLYQAAAKTNNIAPPPADDAASEPGTGGDNADPADEAASPNA